MLSAQMASRVLLMMASLEESIMAARIACFFALSCSSWSDGRIPHFMVTVEVSE
jgi:hypothetical protein